MKLLEKDIAELKSEIDEFKEVNKKLDNSIKNINEKISTTFTIVFERILNLERKKKLEEQKSKEAVREKSVPEAAAVSLDKVEQK